MTLRVLLLDDDEDVTRDVHRALVERACEVVTLPEAAHALGGASAQRFDVIVVAAELVDRIAADPAAAGVPMVVLSKPVAISDVIAALPDRPPSPSLAPSGDLRETIKNQGRVVASLRSDLAARSRTIESLTTKNKELTHRLTDVLALLDKEQKDRAAAVADLETLRHAHAAELEARGAGLAAEMEDRERAHAEETAFIERAHEEANEASSRRLRDSERNLAAERATHAADLEAHAFEIATFRELAANLEKQRDAAIRERDEARTAAETAAMDVAQARMDLAEASRAHTADTETFAQRIAHLENALAAQRDALARTDALQAELAAAIAKVGEMARALEAAEREAIQQELARDAAFHEMNVRATAEREAAVNAAKAEAASEREELVRVHEHAIKVARDKAIAQALAVARERKKQT